MKQEFDELPIYENFDPEKLIGRVYIKKGYLKKFSPPCLRAGLIINVDGSIKETLSFSLVQDPDIRCPQYNKKEEEK